MANFRGWSQVSPSSSETSQSKRAGHHAVLARGACSFTAWQLFRGHLEQHLAKGFERQWHSLLAPKSLSRSCGLSPLLPLLPGLEEQKINLSSAEPKRQVGTVPLAKSSAMGPAPQGSLLGRWAGKTRGRAQLLGPHPSLAWACCPHWGLLWLNPFLAASSPSLKTHPGVSTLYTP